CYADNPVNQQEGVTVRQVIPDLGDVHTVPVVFCCSRCSSILLVVPTGIPALLQLSHATEELIQLARPDRILAPAGLLIEQRAGCIGAGRLDGSRHKAHAEHLDIVGNLDMSGDTHGTTQHAATADTRTTGN